MNEREVAHIVEAALMDKFVIVNKGEVFKEDAEKVEIIVQPKDGTGSFKVVVLSLEPKKG